jgi:putative aminopeptidase FrvX
MKPAKLFNLLTEERVARLAGEIMSPVTAPFHEDGVARRAEAFAAARPWVRLSRDADGNLHLSRKGAPRTGTPAVFSAHMDHPGFVATGARGGFLEADFLGGVSDAYFKGSRVRFFPPAGASVAAVVLSQKKNPKTGERKVLLKARRPVPPRTPGMWDLPPFRRDRRSNRLVSRAVDDLGGAAALLALLDVLPAIDPGRKLDVRGVLTRGEEVGFWGAIAAAKAGRFPRGARMISLETSKAFPHAPLGAGPILRVGDRASVFDDGLTRSLAEAARALAGASRAFRWQRKLMDGGTCEGTAYQALGYRTGALCVPLLNYHNMGEDGKVRAEAIDLSDLANLARWMALWAAEGAAPASLQKRMHALHAAWRPRKLSR